MTNVCNLFRPIDKKTGNFLLFSQYTRDLSRSTVDSSYQVRPSRFVCMDLNDTQLGHMASKSHTSNMNEAPPKYFQNIFENDIAVLRNNSYNINGYNFSTIFFDRLSAAVYGAADAALLPNIIKYVGDVDIFSWENGFADVILNISSGSKGAVVSFKDLLYEYIFGTSSQENVITTQELTDALGKITIPNLSYVSGWTAEDNIPISGDLQSDPTIATGTGVLGETVTQSYVSPNDSVFNQLFTIADSTDNSFSFNTILILYDIIDDNQNVLESDIPMGIYFTGDVEDGSLTNPITIYTSQESAYGAGSGWSLRICTRFSPTPLGTLKVEEVAVESGALSESLSALMAANAEVIKTLNDFADKSIYNSQTIKDMYAIFKNGRTNVPYPREVNGRMYWFVNGRNTEVPCTV